MVAGPRGSGTGGAGLIAGRWWQQRTGTVYLFAVLMKKYTTIAVLAAALLITSWWLKQPVFAYIALIISMLAAISPRLAQGMHTAWMALARVLGWINSRILLTVLFFVILTPIALLARWRGANSLQLRRKPGQDSWFVSREHQYDKTDMEQIW